MDENLADLSQLMAFVDDLGGHPTSEEGRSNEPDAIRETYEWSPPSEIVGWRSNFASVMGLFQEIDSGQDTVCFDSPESPVARIRTSLFSQDDTTAEIEVCGESIDPRNVCVVDHPGRHAQFKSWVNSGHISDDARRVTIREESNRRCCWIRSESDSNKILTVDGGLLGSLIKPRSSVETSIPLLPDLAPSSNRASDHAVGSEFEGAKKKNWRDRIFIVGRSIKVAMRQSGIQDSNVRDWCLWFNDFLCSLGLSDARGGSYSPVTVFEADVDFTDNSLSDVSFRELCVLFTAFRRLQVRSLRLAANSLTDSSLEQLTGFNHLRHLIITDNAITNDGVFNFIVKNRTNRKEYYEVLLAQDVCDDCCLLPITVSLDGNFIRRPIQLIAMLECVGIKPCIPEATGCDLSGICAVLGTSCGVHLSGLGSQQALRGI
jgi:hypothetical protein